MVNKYEEPDSSYDLKGIDSKFIEGTNTDRMQDIELFERRLESINQAK